jgi:hypothetical protein
MVQAHRSVCRKLDGGFSFCSMQNGNRAITKSCANTVYINLLITDEPGKQVSSAIKIKNVSRSHVAFKFQTTAPKSCFMRPPSGVLPPNGSIIATVVKFVEQPERPQEKKNKDKFKIVSLAVKADVEYTPELVR